MRYMFGLILIIALVMGAGHSLGLVDLSEPLKVIQGLDTSISKSVVEELGSFQGEG